MFADGQSVAAECSCCCQVLVSNIPGTDDADRLTAVFESERLTGVADCTVTDVTYDSTDPTCAVVTFTHHKGID